MSLRTKAVVWTLGFGAALVAAGYAAFQLSPWPGALIVRVAFDRGGARISRALDARVPAGITAQLDLRYDVTDEDALLDVFYPSKVADSTAWRPTVVWVHGGGWVAGSKDHVANYLRILAGRGYTVVGVGYSLAPGATYPTPVRQVNAALAYLVQNAGRLRVNPAHFVLAGNSAGAQIAAQLANVLSEPSYARSLTIRPSIDRNQLAGVILYSGSYDLRRINLNGPYGRLMKTVLWSYSGSKDFMNAPRFATGSVQEYVTSTFPPTFISAGNGDPAEPSSSAFAKALAERGVKVDGLFFPGDRRPALPHDYQFRLETEAGRLALDRSVAFLSGK